MLSIESMTERLGYEVARAKDAAILESLNDLISLGLLEVHETGPVLVREFAPDDPYKVSVRTQVKLVLKNREYIEKLEKENTELRDRVNAATAALRDVRLEEKE